jgi:hypothetical protein
MEDDLVFGLISQAAEGVEAPADQAKALGRSVQDVYNARRRLKTHVEQLKASMEEW